MSSNGGTSGGWGVGQGATNIDTLSVDSADSSRSTPSDEMKRTAAKQLIERYFFQLTDGCGESQCSNPNCRSSKHFRFEPLNGNRAAVQALELFKEHAQLCDSKSKPPKVAKIPADEQASSSSMSSGTENSTAISTNSSGSSEKTVSKVKEKPSSSVPKDTPYLDESKIVEMIEEGERSGSWLKLIRSLGMIYHSSDSLMRSFQKEKLVTLSHEFSPECKSISSVVDSVGVEKMDSDQSEVVEKSEGDSAISVGSLGESMDSQEDDNNDVDLSSVTIAKPEKSRTTDTVLNELDVDFDSLRRSYKKLFSVSNLPFNNALINAILSLSRTLEIDLKYHQAYERNPKLLEVFVIVMEIPELSSPEYIDAAFPAFCKTAGALPIEALARLAKIWSEFSEDKLRCMLQSLHQMITVRVLVSQWGRIQCVNDDDAIAGATKLMKCIYYASIMAGKIDPEQIIEAERELALNADDGLQDFFQGTSPREPKERKEPMQDPMEKILVIHASNCRKPVIPYDEFVNDPLNDQIEMDRDYTYYRSEINKFSFMTHSFILNTATKNLGMYYDNRIRMINERRSSVFQSLALGAPMMPYLRLRIRRDHIIDDALVGLEMVASDNPQDLKKQLYVEFEGEQGIDEGGVQKEFFQLIVEEIFNPDIGMFTYNEDSRQFWFNSTSYESDGQFTLIGIVLGLAIYNNVILDVHFPMVVYRKLLGKLGTYADLKDSHPALAQGLQEMLDYEGNVDEAFMHSFRVGYQDVFGNNLTHDLKENGDKISVTNENRWEFVELYADFLLNKSIERQFRAFKRGFAMVTDESPIKMLFRADEVELLVCGSKDFDFHDLETAAEYDGGFTADSQTIRDFWSVVHNFTDEQKRKLLQFTTGSDRVPVGGLSKLKLIISKNGPDSDRLPTSHTCFNVLLLPNYSCKEKLCERLLKAITYAKGFGML